jgi:serine/threonine protein kinase
MRQSNNALPPGSQIADYAIEAPLGSGGFGITYRARSPSGGYVAIKEFFPSEFARRDGELVRAFGNIDHDLYIRTVFSFVEEGIKLRDRFRHDNIVRVFDIVTQNETAYLVMEYIDGFSLLDAVQLGQLTPGQSIFVLEGLLDAVEYLHEMDEIHRDITPSNVMIERSSLRAVLIDFGSSAEGLDLERSDSSLVVANHAFAPPEQMIADGRRVHGSATDIFALGGTIYRVVTGTNPEKPMQRWMSLLHHGSDPYVRISEAVTPAFAGMHSYDWTAVDQALAMKPADRFASIRAFRAALRFASPRAERIADAIEHSLETAIAAEAEDFQSGLPGSLECRHTPDPASPPPA